MLCDDCFINKVHILGDPYTVGVIQKIQQKGAYLSHPVELREKFIQIKMYWIEYLYEYIFSLEPIKFVFFCLRF